MTHSWVMTHCHDGWMTDQDGTPMQTLVQAYKCRRCNAKVTVPEPEDPPDSKCQK